MMAGLTISAKRTSARVLNVLTIRGFFQQDGEFPAAHLTPNVEGAITRLACRWL